MVSRSATERAVFRRTSFSHTAQGPSRFSVPAEFRAALAELAVGEPPSFWAGPTPYGTIACLPLESAEEDLAAATRPWLDSDDDVLVNFRLHLFAHSDRVTPDPSGRISFLPRLCELADVGGKGREVTWVGHGSWFELWSSERLAAHLDTLKDAAPAGLHWSDGVVRKLKGAFVRAVTGLGDGTPTGDTTGGST